MQDSKKTKSRKSSAWYQKAMQVAKIVFRFPNHPISSVEQHKHAKLRKCCSTSAVSSSSSSSSSSFFPATEVGQSLPLTPPRTPPRALSYPSSLTRTSSCLLCSPIPYTDSFRWRGTAVQPAAAAAGGREEAAAFKKPLAAARVVTCPQPHAAAARRRVFRGKSVMDNSLMRKSVIEEEKMMTRRRRDDEFAIMQRRNSLKRRQIGPSPLSRVVMATAE